MPLGKWESFGQCVGAQKRMGHSDESARKICGSIEAKQGGSSQYGAAPSSSQMSEQMQQKQKDEGDGNVTLTMQEAEALANAVFNDDLETAKKILSSVMNIQEEAAPSAPTA